uniref:Uncharacterized protein n=1 Tax=Nelumbo nucifera TaxID=4432 RepID=A0A822YZI7_NELNU|nr:TPA_asm: hypothetical protein HUJ06_008578 [Nelumbo nucifera]
MLYTHGTWERRSGRAKGDDDLWLGWSRWAMSTAAAQEVHTIKYHSTNWQGLSFNPKLQSVRK